MKAIRERFSCSLYRVVVSDYPSRDTYSAHAGLSPWEGQNALDAAVLAYNNISLLRQQIKPTHRVHGIFEGKDWAPNSKTPTISIEMLEYDSCNISYPGPLYNAVS
jgi:hypothetical protein